MFFFFKSLLQKKSHCQILSLARSSSGAFTAVLFTLMHVCASGIFRANAIHQVYTTNMRDVVCSLVIKAKWLKAYGCDSYLGTWVAKMKLI